MTDPMHVPLPPALHDALTQRADGAELGNVWCALPAPEATTDDVAARARRDVAWQRLSNRMHNPARIPTTAADDTGSLGLVNDSDAVVEVLAVRRAVSRDSVKAPRRTIPDVVWRIAAAITLLVGGAAVWQSVPQQLHVAVGAKPATISLADGSRVTLAPGAQLRVARGFRSWYGGPLRERTVQLTGEGFFDVAQDGRSFIVETRDATVRVLGTHFDVRSATSTVGTRVMVEEGRVSVHGRAGSSPALTLAAGDAAIIGAHGNAERLAVASVARASSWRTGGLTAVNEALGDVLAELARRAGVEITLDRDVAADATVTLFYASVPSLERVLADLSAARALHFTRTSRGYRVSSHARVP